MSAIINQIQGLEFKIPLNVLERYESLYDIMYPREQDITDYSNNNNNHNNTQTGKKRKRPYNIDTISKTNKRSRYD